MKKVISDFFLRGLVAGSLGPIVLAFVYMILKQNAFIEYLTVEQVCIGIFTLTGLAFVAGGMNAIYQIERLPLMVAVFIHGLVLYISYLLTYLLNDWLQSGTAPILIFTVIFVVGYLAIWAVIYLVHKKSTDKINRMLEEKQYAEE